MKTATSRRLDLSHLQNVQEIVRGYRHERDREDRVTGVIITRFTVYRVFRTIHLVTRMRENLIISSKKNGYRVTDVAVPIPRVNNASAL